MGLQIMDTLPLPQHQTRGLPAQQHLKYSPNWNRASHQRKNNKQENQKNILQHTESRKYNSYQANNLPWKIFRGSTNYPPREMLTA
jgi:hypothetical protein